MVDGRSGGTSYEVEPDFAARQALVLAVSWLLIAVTIGLLVHLRFFFPDLISGIELLSYGRLRAVFELIVVFGWLTTAGFAAVFALLPRLTESQLHNEVLGAASVMFWSLILLFGAGTIIGGLAEGRPLAEIPPPLAIGLFLMMVFVLYNAGVTAVRRRVQSLYVSAWYLLAAAFLLPLVYLVGNLPVFSGITDALAQGFYLNGLELYWLLPIGLAAAHYVVPVETGNPLYSMRVARIGFWALMFAGGWTGARYFHRGPIPDYVEAITVAMVIVLLIPVISATANLFMTGRGRWHLLGQAFGIRFAVTGLGLLVVWISLVLLGLIPQVSRLVGLTVWEAGVRHLALFGVFTMLAFAFIYHVYPLMVGRDWYSRPAAAFHFWVTVAGAVVGAVVMLVAGVAQGAAIAVWSSAEVPGLVPELVEANVVLQRGFQVTGAVAFGAVAVAQYVFAYNAYRTVRSGPIMRIAEPAAAPVGRIA